MLILYDFSMVQRYEKMSEEQKKKPFFSCSSECQYLRRSQRYEKMSEEQKKKPFFSCSSECQYLRRSQRYEKMSEEQKNLQGCYGRLLKKNVYFVMNVNIKL
jgi:ribosomal protein S21